jgi:uncharacterized protein with FMN-binding domain
MKHGKICALSLIFLAGCVSLSFPRRYTAGIWRGEAAGYYGPIAVSVETDESSILDIEIETQTEDAFIGGDAIWTLREHVIDENRTDIDVISGATVTSEAFLDAVDAALRRARRAQ